MQLLQVAISRKYTTNLTSSNLSVPLDGRPNHQSSNIRVSQGEEEDEELIKQLLVVLSSKVEESVFLTQLQDNPHIHAQIQSFVKVRRVFTSNLVVSPLISLRL